MIVSRYLIRAVVPPWLALTGGLTLIFASYALTRELADAAQGALAPGLMVQIIGLRTIIALEVLLPLGLYLGTIVGLGRLYAENEIVALQAGGYTRNQVMRPLVIFALAAAILVGLLSTIVRPWAYSELYALENAATSQMNIAQISPGRFYSDDDSSMTVYAEGVDHDKQRLAGVFAATQHANHRVVIRAAAMTRKTSPSNAPTLVFHSGHLYEINRQDDDDRVIAFKNLKWQLDAPPDADDYKRKAASTAHLWHSRDPKDVAERQWRLSRPLATLFLALFGVLFARAAPRRGRATNVFAATVLFIVYYNLAGIARNWVEHGAVPTLPGIYWVDGLVGLTLVLLWLRPGQTHY